MGSQLPSWAPTRSAAGAKASRFGANSADSETDWYAAAHSSAKNSTKVGVERMEDGDNRHQQPLQTSDPLAYIDDFNLEPLQLNSQLQYPDMETIRLHRHTSPAFHRPLGSSPPPHSLHTLLPPPQAFPGLQEVRYSSPETPPGSTPSPGSAHSTLPPAPLQLTSLEVTATELVWRGGTLHQQDQALDLRGQCEARLGEWVAMDYPADGDELGEVGDPSADDAILGEESAIISNQQLVNLSVRELNKRLHGVPREEVVKLKQKRRTLKNRGYAQNCRSKRLLQRQDLEENNKALVSSSERMRAELERVVKECGLLRRQVEEYERVHAQCLGVSQPGSHYMS